MLTGPGWLGLPGYIWVIAAAALLMAAGLLAQRAPDIAAAIGRRRSWRAWWARINLTDLSDDAWLAELARMRTERSGQLGPAGLPPMARDPRARELGRWLGSDDVWPQL